MLRTLKRVLVSAALSALALCCQAQRMQSPPPALASTTSQPPPALAPISEPAPAEPARVATAQDESPPAWEPPPSELIEHANGKLVFDDGSPAGGLPIEIETECETLAGFTEPDGTFHFDQLRLPARLRSSDGLLLIESDAGARASSASLVRVPETHGAELAAVTLSTLPAVMLVTPRSRTAETTRMLASLDVFGKGPLNGSALALASPKKLAAARAARFEVVVLDADPNRYNAEASAARSTAWAATQSERIARARASFATANVAQSQRSRGRVRESSDCVERYAESCSALKAEGTVAERFGKVLPLELGGELMVLDRTDVQTIVRTLSRLRLMRTTLLGCGEDVLFWVPGADEKLGSALEVMLLDYANVRIKESVVVSPTLPSPSPDPQD
ncbi:MAG: hypothetical protein QM756_34860 [Polyangiaceae bacterium]